MTTGNKTQLAPLRANEVEYYLCIGLLSPGCRWQELKDVIRKIPPVGHIRQAHTEMANGTGCGHITILNLQKAFDAYDYLKINGWGGQSIRLALGIKDENDPNNLLRLRGPEDSLGYPSQGFCSVGHSCLSPTSALLSLPVSSASIPPNYNYGEIVPYTSHATAPIASLYGSVVPIATSSLVPSQPPTSHPVNTYPSSASPGPQILVSPLPPSSDATPQYRHKAFGRQQPAKETSTASPSTMAAGDGRSFSPSPSSSFNNNNHHHHQHHHNNNNKNNGNDNKARTLYLYNLPYTVDEQAIKDHLASAGVVDRCLVREDRQRSSKYKLTAVVRFRTPQQAQNAINRFNGTTWKGYELRIRLDRGPTVAAPSGPRPSSGGVGKANNRSSPATRTTVTTSRARHSRPDTSEGPLVVNGSGPSITARQGLTDSEDGSSCDEAE